MGSAAVVLTGASAVAPGAGCCGTGPGPAGVCWATVTGSAAAPSAAPKAIGAARTMAAGAAAAPDTAALWAASGFKGGGRAGCGGLCTTGAASGNSRPAVSRQAPHQ